MAKKSNEELITLVKNAWDRPQQEATEGIIPDAAREQEQVQKLILNLILCDSYVDSGTNSTQHEISQVTQKLAEDGPFGFVTITFSIHKI